MKDKQTRQELRLKPLMNLGLKRETLEYILNSIKVEYEYGYIDALKEVLKLKLKR